MLFRAYGKDVGGGWLVRRAYTAFNSVYRLPPIGIDFINLYVKQKYKNSRKEKKSKKKKRRRSSRVISTIPKDLVCPPQVALSEARPTRHLARAG